MQTLQNKEAIISKITKLLALAGNNSNENERNAAMERAYRLLAEHNITMHDVKSTQTSAKISIEKHGSDISMRNSDLWNVMHGVSKLYYTSWYRDSDKTAVVYGTPENVQATITIATWLIDSIERQAKRQYSGRGRVALNSFRRGAAMAVYENARRLVDKEESRMRYEPTKPTADTPVTGTQLMVIRNQLTRANREFAAVDPVLKNIRTTKAGRKQSDYGAYSSGHAYGSTLNLGRQIGGSNNKQISG